MTYSRAFCHIDYNCYDTITAGSKNHHLYCIEKRGLDKMCFSEERKNMNEGE